MPDEAAPSYSETYRVPFGDTDSAGVVFYPNYYRWFDRMTHELFRSLGEPLLAHGLRSEGPVLAQTHCNFLAPTRYDDELALTARIAEVRDRSFRVDHLVSRSGDTVAEGYEVRVWVRLVEGTAQAILLPDSIRTALSKS